MNTQTTNPQPTTSDRDFGPVTMTFEPTRKPTNEDYSDLTDVPCSRHDDSRGSMIFTMGLPASGKSTVANDRYSDHTMLDPDAIKEDHPDYDPKNPQALHGWSQDMMEERFAEALVLGGKFVIDGTGTNAEKMVRRINEAKAAGFDTRLLFVTCTLETSLRRNASRERVVPTDVITSKARDINTSYQIVKLWADAVEVFDNDEAW